jgi:hypothetical protein
VSDHDQDQFPAELEPIAERLRQQRATADPLQLDEIKLRARARSVSRGGRTSSIRSRLATIVAVIGLLGGTSGAVAVGWGDNGDGNGHGADHGEYHEGKGCHKDQEHGRSDECKEHHGGDQQGHKGNNGGGGERHSGDRHNTKDNHGSSREHGRRR